MKRRLVPLAAALALGCSKTADSDAPGTSSGTPGGTTPAPAAARSTIPDEAATVARCKALFGDDTARVLSLAAMPEPDAPRRIAAGDTPCMYTWPEGGPPQGLAQTTFHCGPSRITRERFVETWKRAEPIELDGPGYRLEMGGVTQYWFFEDDCAVVANVGFGAREHGEAFAKHVRSKLPALRAL